MVHARRAAVAAPVMPERDLPCPALDGSIRRRFLSLDLPCKKKLDLLIMDHLRPFSSISTYLTPTSDVRGRRGGETDQKGILQLASSVAVRRGGSGGGGE